MKKLAVGIPTFNGEKYISQTLDSVIFQIDNNISKFVCIVISDNASTDNTENIIRHYIKKYPEIDIFYHRFDSNKGFDVNYDNIFKISNAEYVWTLGDDDCLESGAILTALNYLKDNSLSAIQVNFNKYNLDFDKLVEVVEIKNDILCLNGNQFFEQSKGRWGAIASLIISKNHWNSLDLKDAFETQTIFGYGLFKIILNKPSLIIAKPLVKVRDGSIKSVKNGDGDAKIITALSSGYLYKNLLLYGYNERLIKNELNKDRKYVFQAISIAKYWGIKNKIHLIKRLLSVHNSFSLWIRWIPIILFPDFIYRLIYRIRKKINSVLKPYEIIIKLHLKNNFPISSSN